MDILFHSLTFRYPSGVTALQGVTLEIQKGESIAIIGQNGAGKTTLVKHLNGLLKPTSGWVQVGDWDTRDHSIARLASRVGYVFQNPDDQVFKSTVQAEVSFGLRNLGHSAAESADLIQPFLSMVGLTGYIDRHPYDLSPGERKRVALAAVLAMDPPIIVLDEPTTGQDYSGVELIGQIIDQLNKKGKTILTVSHDIDFCAEHCPRVVVMVNGMVQLDGPSQEVLSKESELALAYVEPPQLIRLAMKLGMNERPLTAKEFISARYHFGNTNHMAL
jgi:energy-coupling factor transport system ATP-binding protein